MTEQHVLNVEYLRAKGWTRMTNGSWLPTELLETNSEPMSFEQAMNLQCDLDGEPRDMSCLQGAIK